MKLSTFLLLLDNRLFIPSLRILQGDGSFEARIPGAMVTGSTIIANRHTDRATVLVIKWL